MAITAIGEVYPTVYVDALMVKVRDGGTVRNKACYLVFGVSYDGVNYLGPDVMPGRSDRGWL